MPFGNHRTDVPKGQLEIVRRFDRRHGARVVPAVKLNMAIGKTEAGEVIRSITAPRSNAARVADTLTPDPYTR